MRIALLSNVTVEVLAGMLKKEHSLWLPSGFGAWMETALSVPVGLKDFNPEAVFLLLDSRYSQYDPAAVDIAVTSLETALPQSTIIVPDLEDLAEEVGSFYDERMWKIGLMPWSMKGLRAIGEEIKRLVRAMMGERKKVLAIDLDNTIWQGVIGEDGIRGVRPFADLQREIKSLRERGVLLAVLSKNNAADVEPVWNDPRMVLKREDFVGMRIDWNDKAMNLVALAKMLNLGVDSFVFLDDNPVERAQMMSMLPDVTVPDWPVSIRRLSRMYFPKLRITDEDRQKTEQYHAEAKRKELAAGLSVDDYLRSLEIRTEIHPVTADEFSRVAQLSQKTNQFNVCTNRYTVDDIARFATDPEHLLVTLHASDKFGDQGLVAFVHVAAVASEDSPLQRTYQILDWVMSCRVMNRRIEFTVQEWLEQELKKHGVSKLLATWRKTAKNVPVQDLFEKFGFTEICSSVQEKKYERVLP